MVNSLGSTVPATGNRSVNTAHDEFWFWCAVKLISPVGAGETP